MLELMKYSIKIDEYVSRLRIGVVCSRFVMNLLWRAGVDCIRYVGDFITPQDVFCDVSLDVYDANSYDIPNSKEDTLVISNLASELSLEFFEKALRGCDVVISHRYCKLSAKAAERLGVPFIPPAVTCFLPEDIDSKIEVIEKLEKELPRNPIGYSMLCSAQVMEVLRLCTNGEALLAPEAYLIKEKPPFFEKVKLW